MTSTSNYFLHLSDIHFKYFRGRPDLDEFVRRDLLKDIGLCMAEIGKVDGIFITGDIAFSAQKEQYEIADAWIREVASLTKCGSENIVMVPGNHDVDWVQCEKPTPELLKANLRKSKNIHELDKIIGRYFAEDDPAIKILYDSFSVYNNFAARYSCDVGPTHPSAEKTITGRTGDVFKIVGFNTCLVSSKTDDKKIEKLILDSHVLDVDWNDSVIHISLGHHPPDWLLFTSAIEMRLNARFSLQLFGHKHTQNIKRINDGVLRVYAGAVHPVRDIKTWYPVYNFIKVSKGGLAKGSRTIDIEVLERVWVKKKNIFSAAEPPIKSPRNKFNIKLPKRRGLRKPSTKKVKNGLELALINGQKMVQMVNKNLSNNILYDFFKLPHPKRLKILIDFGVYEKADTNEMEVDMCKNGLLKIAEAGKVDELVKRIAVEKV